MRKAYPKDIDIRALRPHVIGMDDEVLDGGTTIKSQEPVGQLFRLPAGLPHWISCRHDSSLWNDASKLVVLRAFAQTPDMSQLTVDTHGSPTLYRLQIWSRHVETSHYI